MDIEINIVNGGTPDAGVNVLHRDLLILTIPKAVDLARLIGNTPKSMMGIVKKDIILNKIRDNCDSKRFDISELNPQLRDKISKINPVT